MYVASNSFSLVLMESNSAWSSWLKDPPPWYSEVEYWAAILGTVQQVLLHMGTVHQLWLHLGSGQRFWVHLGTVQ
jgi:uncharacterized damage-inducible protein DinB